LNEKEVVYVTVKIWIADSLYYNVRIPFLTPYPGMLDTEHPQLGRLVSVIGEVFEYQMGLKPQK
jgi:hypothetical protein